MTKLTTLQKNARACRMLAETSLTEEARMVLDRLAKDYEAQASQVLTTGRGHQDDCWHWTRHESEQDLLSK